jgi:hypothetical protein
MTDTSWADFKHAATVLGTVSTLLATVDWDDLAAIMDRADTLGPILDPTAYRDSLHNGTLGRNRQVINATRTYLAELRQAAP